MEDNVLVISHREDIDGIASAALLKAKYGIPDSRIFYVDYTERMLEGAYNAIRKLGTRNATLYITDLNANDHLIGVLTKIMHLIKDGGGRVLWLDHHPWSKKSTDALSPLCDTLLNKEGKLCATELVLRRLKLQDRFFSTLALVTHYSDFNLKPRTIEYGRLVHIYGFGISYYNMMCAERVCSRRLAELARALTNHRFTDRNLVASATLFERLARQRTAVMLKDLRYVGGSIAVGFSRSITYREACTAVLRKSGRPVAVYVNIDSGRTSITSEKPDVTALAWAFGGGGHPHASGFGLDTKVYNVKTEVGRAKFLAALQKKSAELGVL